MSKYGGICKNFGGEIKKVKKGLKVKHLAISQCLTFNVNN